MTGSATRSSTSTGPALDGTGPSRPFLQSPSPIGNATLSVADSPASPSVSQESGSGRTTNDGYGLSLPEWFARYDPESCSWKTCQGSLFEAWETFSETWPRAGMTVSGIAYRRQPLVPTSEATECLSSPVVPRPVACDGKGSGRIRHERLQGMNLRDWWNVNYGYVYPPARMTEYLMGFPLGWTDCEPSGTP